jgi:hypothetical protein
MQELELKVRLEKKKRRHVWRAEDSAELPVSAALPFYISRMGKFVHRIRYGTVYFRKGKFSHVGLQMYCGQIGGTSKGDLIENPNGHELCRVCIGH